VALVTELAAADNRARPGKRFWISSKREFARKGSNIGERDHPGSRR